jgi:uncharacterized membrane protein
MLSVYIYFAVIYFIVDMIWITLSSKFHKSALQSVQNKPLKINMISGTLYYIVIPFIISYVITVYTKTFSDALRLGAILAVLMFATFELTNKTVFENYPYWYAGMDFVGGVSSIVLSLYIAMSLAKLHRL